MRKVTYVPGRCIPPTKAAVWFDNVSLQPGDNYLPDADFARLEKHPDLSTYIGWGAIAIEPEPIATVPATAPADLSTLSVDEAKPIIAAETDKAVLEAWLSDSRKGIKTAVSDRLAELEG